MFHNITYIHHYLLGQIRRIYFMALPESKEDMKKSRIYYTTADSASQTITQLAGGTFLATIMSFSGISDANIGIITSLVSLAALSQLFMINYLKQIKKYKFLVCITSLQRILFALIYFVPLLPLSNSSRASLIVAFYLLGQIFVQIGTPPSQDWIASLIPSRLRGKYLAIKDSVAVFMVSSLMLISGMVFDYYKEKDLIIGFIIVGILIAILTLVNVVALSKMKEAKVSYINEQGKEMHGRLAKHAKRIEQKMIIQDTPQASLNPLSELKTAFMDKKFRKAFAVQAFYITGFYSCIPFTSSYQINDLELPYTYIMLVGFIANLYRIYITPKLGRLADKHGMAKLLRYTLIALALHVLSNAFMVPSNAMMMQIVSSIFSSTAWAFVGIGLFGVQLDFYHSEKRMLWLTITSSLTGLLGFVVSIIAGALLDYLQRNPLIVLGQQLYAQQILNVAGFFILIVTALYIKQQIETEKIANNRKDGRIK